MWTVRAAPRRTGHTRVMVLRIDPRLPLVWRSPYDVQLGIDPPRLRLDDLSETQERMLAALVSGVSETGLGMIARGKLPERDDLLARLQPVLHSPTPAETATVAISGDGPVAAAIGEVLGRTGVRVLASTDVGALADRGADLAVLVAEHVLAPHLHGVWLRRDVTHLPVVLTESAVHIGPMVEPGSGPCLLCLELHRRDEDSAWPAIAAQLLGRRAPAPSAVIIPDTAALVGRMVLERLAGRGTAGVSVRIDEATGDRRESVWGVHPECGCSGLPTPDRPMSDRLGSDWASAARLGPVAALPTSSATGSASPA